MSTAPTTKISRISSDHHQWSNSFLASNQIRDEVPVINEPTEEKLTEFVKFPELALEIRRMIFKAALPLAGAVYVCITNTKGDGKGTVVEYIADRIRDSTLCSLRATCRDAKDVVDDYYIQCHFGKCTDPIFEPRIKPFVDFKHDTVVLTGCGPAIPGLWRYGYLKLSPGCSTKRHHTIELELPKIQKVAIGVHHETIGSYSDCLVYDQEDRAKFAKAVCPDAKEVTWLVKPPTVNPFQGFRYYRASDVDLTNIVWDASNAVRVEIDFEESKYGDIAKETKRVRHHLFLKLSDEFQYLVDECGLKAKTRFAYLYYKLFNPESWPDERRFAETVQQNPTFAQIKKFIPGAEHLYIDLCNPEELSVYRHREVELPCVVEETSDKRQS